MTPNKLLKGRSGIYGILNRIDGKVYVGKTKCMFRRCAQYVSCYRARTRGMKTGSVNDYLFAAIQKHGIENFEFFVVEFCEMEKCDDAELNWMRIYKSTDAKHGYNLRMDSRTGMTVSSLTSERIRGNLKRQWASGVRASHSEKMKARWAESDRRPQQAQVMTRALTRYDYLVDGKSHSYADLKAIGLHGVVGKFARYLTDTTLFKGRVISRVRIK